MSLSYLVKCDSNEGGCDKVYPGDLEICPKCGASTALIAIHAMLPIGAYVYDIESYPNIFTLAITHVQTDTRWLFEISTRKNDYVHLVIFLYKLKACNAFMVGFNNVHYDYSMVHFILEYKSVEALTVDHIYAKSMSIIDGEPQKMIWDNQRHIRQIDLFKIHHYDNQAKRTSLKALEFAMRMKSIKDLPYPPGTTLTYSQMDELISYNWHDVLATCYFYVRSLEPIEFRSIMSDKYGKDMSNMSDSKIGSTIFELKLNQAGIVTKEGRYPIQTIRTSIPLIECIPDYIKFEHPDFIAILDRFKSTTLKGDNVKALFKNFNCEIDELKYVFGSGGQHACRKGKFESDDEYIIVDQDVGAMYPSIAIAHGFYPEHLGEKFSLIYKELVDERMRVGKKTPMGAGLKISANASYGNSGNKYSYLFDLKYLLSTTLTGQLTLLMLVEQIIKIPNCTMIQTNTDGITYRIPKIYLPHVEQVTKWWEGVTGLELEDAYYSRLWMSDVNNYIAEYSDCGGEKLKGKYAIDLEYHKDASALVIPIVAKEVMVNGADLRHCLMSQRDPFDFMLRAKVPRSNKLVMRWKGTGVEIPLQKITRYFITKTGGSLIKIAPAKHEVGQFKRANKLTDEFFSTVMMEIGKDVWDERIHTKNKKVYEDDVETGINSNELVTVCDDTSDFNWDELDFDYYEKKIKEIIIE